MSERLLESRISALRGQVRRLLVFHGLSWVVAAVVPLVILAGLADWLVPPRRRRPPGAPGWPDRRSRLWLGYRRVLRPLVVRFADLDIALRIEERWPGLNDRLASTIQFLRLAADDDGYGSPALREATVRQAIEETRVDRLPRGRSSPGRSLRAAGLAAGGRSRWRLLIVGCRARARRGSPCGGSSSPSGATAGRSRRTWPSIERGTTLKIARGDRSRWRCRSGRATGSPNRPGRPIASPTAKRSIEPLRAAEGGEFRGRIETVNQPFRFSVAGGDDTQLDPRRRGQGRPAARAQPPDGPPDLARRTPGIAPQTLAPGLTQFRVLEGTRIELEAAGQQAARRGRAAPGRCSPSRSRSPSTPAGPAFQTQLPGQGQRRPSGSTSRTPRASGTARPSATTSGCSRTRPRAS